MLAVVWEVTPPTVRTTGASPLLMLAGTWTLICTSPAPTTPAKATVAGWPPMVAVTVLANGFAPLNTLPEGTTGLAGPKPVPQRMLVSPGWAGDAVLT